MPSHNFHTFPEENFQLELQYIRTLQTKPEPHKYTLSGYYRTAYLHQSFSILQNNYLYRNNVPTHQNLRKSVHSSRQNGTIHEGNGPGAELIAVTDCLREALNVRRAR